MVGVNQPKKSNYTSKTFFSNIVSVIVGSSSHTDICSSVVFWTHFILVDRLTILLQISVRVQLNKVLIGV